MAVFSNDSKNTGTFTLQSFGFGDLIWDDANFTWNDANGTWNAPLDVYANDSKNTTSFNNETKN
jgi:hypothetical protein